MKGKNQPIKIVKGGVRATLALLFSIVALAFSIITFYRTTDPTEQQTEIQELKEKLDKVKKETSERIGKIRRETANAVKKLGIEIKKQTEESEDPGNQ